MLRTKASRLARARSLLSTVWQVIRLLDASSYFSNYPSVAENTFQDSYPKAAPLWYNMSVTYFAVGIDGNLRDPITGLITSDSLSNRTPVLKISRSEFQE